MKTLLEMIKKNHALAMILCCAIPLVGILALSSLGVLGSWGYYALILICPGSNISMKNDDIVYISEQQFVKISLLN
jgi:hypothetical protein